MLKEFHQYIQLKKPSVNFKKPWNMRDPDRGVEVIADDCNFEDIARGGKLAEKDTYRENYYHWREALPDELCKT